MVQEINAADFLAAVQENKAVVLKVGAPWCGACKAIAPVVEQVAVENFDVKFYDINADQNVDYVMGLGIRSLPTFVFFKDGQMVDSVKGLTEAQLRDKVEALRA
jgi:thioredoxin 1